MISARVNDHIFKFPWSNEVDDRVDCSVFPSKLTKFCEQSKLNTDFILESSVGKNRFRFGNLDVCGLVGTGSISKTWVYVGGETHH
jgi:hypothetical protein